MREVLAEIFATDDDAERLALGIILTALAIALAVLSAGVMAILVEGPTLSALTLAVVGLGAAWLALNTPPTVL